MGVNGEDFDNGLDTWRTLEKHIKWNEIRAPFVVSAWLAWLSNGKACWRIKQGSYNQRWSRNRWTWTLNTNEKIACDNFTAAKKAQLQHENWKELLIVLSSVPWWHGGLTRVKPWKFWLTWTSSVHNPTDQSQGSCGSTEYQSWVWKNLTSVSEMYTMWKPQMKLLKGATTSLTW